MDLYFRSMVLRWICKRGCGFYHAAGLLLILLFPGFAAQALTEDYMGVLEPLHELNLSVGIGGIVSHLPFQPGDTVQKGDLLLQLEDTLQHLEAERRRLIFENETDLRVIRENIRILDILVGDAKILFEQSRSISRDDLMKLEMELATARGTLDNLIIQKQREKLEYQISEKEKSMRRITAPISGVITQLEIEEGEWAQPGEPVLQMIDASICVLRINVPERFARTLQSGQRIPVHLDDFDQPFQGHIRYIAPIADRGSGLVEVKIEISNSDLGIRPGIKGILHPPATDF